jgi:DNA-binding response OmpR family regulator
VIPIYSDNQVYNEDGDIIKRKIVCVDDVFYSLMAIKERLKEKYEIYPVQSVEKMFEILDRFKPDVIIMDVNMPDVDGFTAIGQLKANPAYARIPVIFLTGQKNKKTMIQGMHLGAADMITKPYTTELLIERIEYLFDKNAQAENKPVIFSVDDNPSILQAINSMLTPQYIVYTLPNPQLLTEVLKKTTPDIFLLDYNMPGLTGFDIVPLIRKFPQHKETPIIFLTSEGTVDFVTVATSLGVCDYIVKPIDEKVLKKKMELHTKEYILRRLIRSLEEEGKH